MTYPSDYTKAATFAAIIHAEHVDKAGRPYIEHVRRVAFACKTYGAAAVGYLHDVVEDSAVTADDLLRMGFSPYVVKAVEVLTRTERGKYPEYITRVIKTPGLAGAYAREVKIADIEDHLSGHGGFKLPPSMREKYETALSRLKSRDG